jgi:hypothetical protein
MARVSYEFQITTGEPSAELSAKLTELSARGWDVAGMTYGAEGLIVLLRREKDFEVARSLQVAFEESKTSTEAISHLEIPPEEMGA